MLSVQKVFFSHLLHLQDTKKYCQTLKCYLQIRQETVKEGMIWLRPRTPTLLEYYFFGIECAIHTIHFPVATIKQFESNP